eukprot:4006169-Karenia_brevis.AAC.1
MPICGECGDLHVCSDEDEVENKDCNSQVGANIVELLDEADNASPVFCDAAREHVDRAQGK